MTPLQLRTMRIGLVLSGGGAKGAYQIGCWRSLREAGLDRFEAIAGSSVGAINAVLVATGRLDTAEAAWRGLRMRDVIGFSPRSVLRLPAWMLAGLGSEFSPFKLTRLSDRITDGRTGWFHPAVCLALAALLWGLAGALASPWRTLLPAVPLLLGMLALAHRLTRPVFLRPVFTTSAPLARTFDGILTDADLARMRETGPVYGVLSQFCPGAPGAHRWGGWVPGYVRLDRLADAGALCRTLRAGCAVPGFLEGDSAPGAAALDGAWTDNVPIAPLLFAGHDLDVIIVIYLKKVVRHGARPNSLWALVRLLARDAIRGREDQESLLSWASTRWAASGGNPRPPAAVSFGSAQPRGPAGSRGAPLILAVAPSRRIGNFFTGTLWFSKAKSASLISLGAHDMRTALARLSRLPAAATSPRTRPGTPAAAPPPVPALLRRSTLRAIWRSRHRSAAAPASQP